VLLYQQLIRPITHAKLVTVGCLKLCPEAASVAVQVSSCKISGSDGGEYEDESLQGYRAE
jgi:hypothetical protein